MNRIPSTATAIAHRSRLESFRLAVPSRVDDRRFVQLVFDPSDSLGASHSAFAHALAISLRLHSELRILHGRQGPKDRLWTEFPSVRDTFERWGVLRKCSSRSVLLGELGIRVINVSLKGGYDAEALLAYVERHPTDLVILTTQGREDLTRWIRRSMADAVVRRSGTMMLFVPAETQGFVSDQDGSLRLRRILVPVDRSPNPKRAVAFAGRLARAASHGVPVEVALLHVGERSIVGLTRLIDPETKIAQETGATLTATLAVRLEEGAKIRWHRLRYRGDVAEEILQVSEEVGADLVVMASVGKPDLKRGGVTTKVVARSPCPVLVAPEHQGVRRAGCAGAEASYPRQRRRLQGKA